MVLSLDGDLREGVVSLALLGRSLARPDRLVRPLAGLLVDEWNEVIPHRDETTGIALRHDPQNAAPPQAIPLAVPPLEGEPSTVGRLDHVRWSSSTSTH